MKFVLSIVLAICFVKGIGQTLMSIQNEPVTVDEFKKIYQRNNASSVSYSRKDVMEYLDLFTLYKMKLIEARNLRMDTISAIQDDYVKYTDQLARKMVTDKSYVENILRAQYQHMQQDIKITHIMVKCDQNASPADSLIAYNKILYIKGKTTALNFAEMAKENSEDKSSATNGGLLGYITAFMTTSDFEDQCYNTPINSVSPIFRTQFGYHILKVLEKRPARGRVKAAHIYVNDKSEEDTKNKFAETEINKAYKELINKAPFETVAAKYSQDKTSQASKGELPEFGVSEMIQEFEDQTFSLKNNGDFSKPFKTTYGWHIVKLISKIALKSYEESKDMIRQKLERDPRIANINQITTQRIAQKYALKENVTIVNEIYKTMNDTFFAYRNWTIKVGSKLGSETAFFIDNKVYTVQDFVQYCNKKFNATISQKSDELLTAMYNEYRDRMLWDYVKQKLQQESEEYRSLEKEYMNGLMIFELMDREIWKKAINDTVGSKRIYEEMKNDFKYGMRITLGSIKTRNKDVNERLKSFAIGNKSIKEIYNAMKKSKDSSEVIYFERTVEKGDDPNLDAQAWTAGNRFSIYDEDEKMYSLNIITAVLEPSVKPFSEIKGRIQNIYQSRLESQYNQNLRNKYKVSMNQEVLKTLIKE
jgi:peptidyl-prolyl cis-trans isomerase SurA